jgi:hypothetical protein
MYVKLSWRPEVYENWAIMVVQPPILNYPTMVFYFWLPPQVLWNDLRGIVIKQRAVGYNKKIYLCFHPLPIPMVARITKYLNKYVRMGICLIYMSSFYFWSPSFARKNVQTFWGIIHVCQAILETGSGRQLSHNGCTAGNLTYPTMVFYFWLGPQDKTVYLCFHPFPVPMAARITKYLNKYVRRGLCLIYIFSFYIKQWHWQTFWGIIHADQASLRTGSCLLRS